MKEMLTDWRCWLTLGIALTLVLLGRGSGAFVAGVGAFTFYLHFVRQEI